MSFSAPKIDKAPPPPAIPEEDPTALRLPSEDITKRTLNAAGRAALRIDPVANNIVAAGGTGLNVPL